MPSASASALAAITVDSVIALTDSISVRATPHPIPALLMNFKAASYGYEAK